MSWLRRIANYLFVWLRRDQHQAELEEEMRFHRELEQESLEAAGTSAAEAHVQAIHKFGNSLRLREEAREAWGTRWLDTLLQDARFAARRARHERGFTAVAVLTLALAIGANTTVFSLLEAVALRPLPFPEADRLCLLWTLEAESQRGMHSSYPDFADWRRMTSTFESMSAYHEGSFNLTGAGEPDSVQSLHSTPDLFPVLGISPALGRVLTSSDSPRTVVLSHGLWQRRFASDPGVIGRTIQLDRIAYTVVGVMPQSFRFPPNRFGAAPEVFVPLEPSPERSNRSYRVVARLRSGNSLQQAQSEMTGISRLLAPLRPAAENRQGIRVQSMRDHAISDSRRVALMLMGATIFVLLIACANLANLLLAQNAARAREIAIRVAIGAGRARIFRQLLTESLLLSVAGAVIGLGFAWMAVPAITAIAPERTALFTRVRDAGVELNGTVLLFTAGISAVAAVLFGIAPALRTCHPARSSDRVFHQGVFRGILVSAEVALAFVLLAGAGLMIHSLFRLLEVDLGFATRHRLVAEISLPQARYAASESQLRYLREVLRRIESMPGVQSVGATVDLPLTRSWTINGVEFDKGRKGRAMYHSVTPSYLATMRIAVLEGRGFREADSENAARVALVNRTMANKYWPGASPLGAGIMATRGYLDRTSRKLLFDRYRVEIVGIVGDLHHISRDAPAQPELYFPMAQRPSPDLTLVIQAEGDPAHRIPEIRREIWRVDPDQPIVGPRPFEEIVATDVAERRFLFLVIGAAALLALSLASIGIYGVVSYSVRQRTQEIGIRMALGASSAGVMQWILRQTGSWIVLGLGVGLLAALGVNRLLGSYLYGVAIHDPLTLFAAAAALGFAGLLANLVPVRRALRVNAVEALRYE